MLARIILWLFLALIFSTFIYWHYHERKLDIRDPRFKLSNPPKKWLRYFARSKPLQLALIILCYSLFIVLLDWRLYQAHGHIQQLTTKQTEIAKEKEALADSLLTLMEESQKPLPLTAPATAPENTPPNVDDVYNPENALSGAQPAMDALKKRYEEILVTHFFLKKCDLAPASDYHIIISSLSQEMASINAPGRLQYDVVTAARGSYKEIYSQSPCKDESMSALQTQYAQYISSLSQNLPTP